MIFLLLIAILLINCIILQYNFIPLVVNVLINNAVLYLNFILFFISIVRQKNKYGINKGNQTIAAVIPFVFITIYYIIRKTEITKPFSDFFGYYVIESDLNSLLNKTKKHKGIVFRMLMNLIGIFYTFDSSSKYIENPSETDYENNWNTFINSIPFKPNGINIQSGGKQETKIEKVIDFFFDFYVKKDTKKIEKIIEKSKLDIKINDIMNLLDRKFLISKIIWLILIIIITQSIYMILIIRDR